MVLCRSHYRLVGLDGRSQPVLDTPYETLLGSRCSPGQRGIAVEAWTANGELRAIDYPMNCLMPSPMASA